MWTNSRSRRTTLILFGAGIFAASVARADDFKIYQLQVYCGNPQLATVIFGHTVEGRSFGTKVICAGKCWGSTVAIKDVLAGLPADVSKALTAKLQKHEEDAAAGKGQSLAGCECDKTALEKAKAEYVRLLAVYESQRSNADALSEEAHKVVKEGQELFEGYFAGQTKKLALKVLGKVSKEAATGTRIYTNPGTRDAVIKEAVGIFKDLSKSLKGGRWAKAAPVADVIAMLMDLGFANAKMLTLLGDFDRYAKEAQNAADAALDALKKARAAKEKVDALEAPCRAAESSGTPPQGESEEDDEFKPTGQREQEAAVKLRDSWKHVEGGYEDTQGNWYSANAALMQAQEIIQSGETGAAEPQFRKVALELGNQVGAVQTQISITDKKAVEAGNLMAVGFAKEARALDAYLRMKAELERIKQLIASRKSAQKSGPH